MKLRLKSKQQRLFAVLMLFGLLSIQGFAQMAKKQTFPSKISTLSKTELELTKKISLDSIKELYKCTFGRRNGRSRNDATGRR